MWAYTERSNPSEPLSASVLFDAASKAKHVYAVRYCPKKSDEPQLPPEYEEYRDVFSEEEADKLPPRGHSEHAIEMTADPPYGPIYSLPEKELKVLREYLDDSLQKG